MCPSPSRAGYLYEMETCQFSFHLRAPHIWLETHNLNEHLSEMCDSVSVSFTAWGGESASYPKPAFEVQRRENEISSSPLNR